MCVCVRVCVCVCMCAIASVLIQATLLFLQISVSRGLSQYPLFLCEFYDRVTLTCMIRRHYVNKSNQ